MVAPNMANQNETHENGSGNDRKIRKRAVRFSDQSLEETEARLEAIEKTKLDPVTSLNFFEHMAEFGAFTERFEMVEVCGEHVWKKMRGNAPSYEPEPCSLEGCSDNVKFGCWLCRTMYCGLHYAQHDVTVCEYCVDEEGFLKKEAIKAAQREEEYNKRQEEDNRAREERRKKEKALRRAARKADHRRRRASAKATRSVTSPSKSSVTSPSKSSVTSPSKSSVTSPSKSSVTSPSGSAVTCPSKPPSKSSATSPSPSTSSVTSPSMSSLRDCPCTSTGRRTAVAAYTEVMPCWFVVLLLVAATMLPSWAARLLPAVLLVPHVIAQRNAHKAPLPASDTPPIAAGPTEAVAPEAGDGGEVLPANAGSPTAHIHGEEAEDGVESNTSVEWFDATCFPANAGSAHEEAEVGVESVEWFDATCFPGEEAEDGVESNKSAEWFDATCFPHNCGDDASEAPSACAA